jgi:hypothetical protein
VSGFELSALEPVFRAIKLADLDLVLVGGHAYRFTLSSTPGVVRSYCSISLY